jgi:signal peptidase I
MELQSREVYGVKGAGRARSRIQPETRTGHILLCTLLWSTITFLLIHRFVLATVVVEGESMTPTLKPGDCCLVNCWLPLFRGYHRGEIVVIRDQEKAELMVKRVVGLPLDWVQVREGQVYINGRRLQEAYLPSSTFTSPRKWGNNAHAIARDCYFVLGDNRPTSEDSRAYGAVNRADLLGLISR